jgi:hypothetical protein
MIHPASLRLLFVVALATAFVPAAARAQDNSAAVEALFDEGKKLEAAGNYAAACPKFLASYNLEHRTGTLLNLADCYERIGLLASAWARFVEARTMAQRAGQQDRADFAQQHASALEGRLSRLTIVVPAGIAGLEVKRDGTAVDPAEFGIAVPLDPGDHTIEASAPGKLPWKGGVHIDKEGASSSIQVPLLEEAPVAPAPAPPPSVAPQPSAPAPVPPPEPEGPNVRKIVGLAIGATGVVVAGIGGVFALKAISSKSTSDPYCDVNGNANACYPPGVQPRQDAVSEGNLASILLGVGGVMIAGGLVVWLTAPSPHAVTASFDGRSLALSGSF